MNSKGANGQKDQDDCDELQSIVSNIYKKKTAVAKIVKLTFEMNKEVIVCQQTNRINEDDFLLCISLSTHCLLFIVLFKGK